MGTRSFVGVMKGDVCRAVYVHWDGYLTGVGAAIQEYTSQKDVERLIAPGDRSSIFDGFYKDRGETGVEPVDYKSFDEFYEAAKGAWAEYYYIFKDGIWYCGDTYEETPISRKLVPFEQAISKEEIE